MEAGLPHFGADSGERPAQSPNAYLQELPLAEFFGCIATKKADNRRQLFLHIFRMLFGVC